MIRPIRVVRIYSALEDKDYLLQGFIHTARNCINVPEGGLDDTGRDKSRYSEKNVKDIGEVASRPICMRRRA